MPAPTTTSGVIDNAPSFAQVLENVAFFLLQLIGTTALIGIMLSGILYFFSQGNPRRIDTAKNALLACIIGLLVAFGSWILIKTIAGFFA